MKILDSGERREFNSGAVRDMSKGKGRLDLLPPNAILEIAKHCEAGCKKYGEHNAEKGIPVHSFIDSALRHLFKFVAGYKDEPHLIAAGWNILMAIEMYTTHSEMIDIPWSDYPEKYVISNEEPQTCQNCFWYEENARHEPCNSCKRGAPMPNNLPDQWVKGVN